jgi:hypothetical protein
MRFLKYFEAKETPDELMVKYADDIIRVLPLYYNSHSTDNLHNQIDELIWDCREADRLRGDAEVLTEEVIRQLLQDLGGSGYPLSLSHLRTREVEKLLNIYYDCLPHTKSIDPNIEKDIEEVFLDYSDMGEVSVSKVSKFNDNRYEVRITMKDIFFKINFEEVFGRIKELGFESYAVNGVKNGSSENMTIDFWKPLAKEEE